MRTPEQPLRFTVTPGAVVAHAGHTVVIREIVDSTHVRVRDVATGSISLATLGELGTIVGGLGPLEANARWDHLRRSTRDEWHLARQRERVIRRIFDDDGQTVAQRVARASRTLGLSRSSVYRLAQRYHLAAQTSSLLRGHRGTPEKHRRLSTSREVIVTRAIDEYFLRRPRAKVSQLIEEVRDRCQRTGLKPVSRKAIEMRISLLDPRLVKRRRHGAKAAHDAFGPVGGTYAVDKPLDVFQIDHTRVDAVVVDPLTRKAIARPWLTLIVDVATRCVMGMSVSLDPPSIHSVSLALTHACLTKERWIAERGLDLEWPMYGLPRALHMDNAQEFRSDAIRRGCDEYGIRKIFRPIATPHFGGHIERLIGTLMGSVHLLPGSTASNVAERGDYNAEKSATMTLAEFERWLALQIAGIYHHRIHRILGVSPLAAWQTALEHDLRPSLPDARPFTLNFLPLEIRKLVKDGIHLNCIRYWSARLPLVARLGDELIVRYDPRDLSRIHVLGRDGEYHDVVYGDVRHPPISLWEYRFARDLLRAQQRKVDEIGIFTALDQQRAIVAAASRATRSARLRGPTVPTPAHESSDVDYSLPIQNLDSETVEARR